MSFSLDPSSLPPREPAGKVRLRFFRNRLGFFLVTVCLAIGSVFTYRFVRNHSPVAPPILSAPVDPRIRYAGPFRNVPPGVGYVGSTACYDCHDKESKAYRNHPMGRSMAPLADGFVNPSAEFGEKGFLAFRSRFQVITQDKRTLHRQIRLDAEEKAIFSSDLEARYAIGSGTRGYSFLAERDGFLFQTPISWYAQKAKWDLSPGFPQTWLRGRPIAAECLFCHANRVIPHEGTVNGFDPPIFEGCAIGCERCHGPGGLHVAERTQGVAIGAEFDDTIFNSSPRHRIDPALSDAVCEQCHLAGEARVLRRGRNSFDYRPGLSPNDFWSVFVRDRHSEPDDKAVNHVEQMHLSRCYQRSAGDDKLHCTSCHDPHVKITTEQRADFYRQRCLNCHREKGCSLPKPIRLEQNQDSCIACHVPRYPASDIPHTAASDHRIVRRAEKSLGEGHRDRAIRAIASFYPISEHALEADTHRDRGIALSRLCRAGKGETRQFASQAIEELNDYLLLCPDDAIAFEARGLAYVALGREDEALRDLEDACRIQPNRETALQSAALLAQKSGNLDKALSYWRRAVEVNPQSADYRGNLASLLAHNNNWEEASALCRVWLRLDPGNVEARQLWIRCLRQLGNRPAAREQTDLLRRLRQ